MRFALLLVAVWLTPGWASATLTRPVDGFEQAVNAAWNADAGCGGLFVEDLALHDGALALTTTRPLSLHLSHHEDAPVCSAAGWQVSLQGQRGPDAVHCAQAFCDLLPHFDAALERARLTGGHEEALPPFIWAPPRSSPLGLVWLASCLAVLLLPLLLVGRRAAPVPLLPLLAVAMLGLAVRWWLMRHTPLCNDEAVSWGFDNLWRELDGREVPQNPPLYRVLSFPVSVLSHGDPMRGRITAVLLGGALVFAVGLLGGSILNPTAGLLAALIAALHPGLALATMYHRSYATLVVWSAFALLATHAAIRSGRARDRYLAGSLWAGTILSHYFGAGLVLGLGIWALWSSTRRRDWLGPAALVLLLASPFVPAVLMGAAQKVAGDNPLVGWGHAGKMALSIPAVLGGFATPMLEATISAPGHGLVFAVLALLLVAALVLAWKELQPRAGTGLVLALIGAAALPIVLAPRMGGVREFQALAAAVPTVVLLAAALMHLPHRALRVGGVVLLLLWFSRELAAAPGLVHASDAQVVETIRAQSGPIFVWPPDAFFRLAPALGLRREEADLSATGKHARLRTLRSCSTAALREAATDAMTALRVVLIDSDCTAEHLSGRGVTCGPQTSLGPGVHMTTCEVDPSAIPRRGPAQPPPTGPKHITPGHEQLFVDAARPYALGKPIQGEVVLANIRIQEKSVDYELTSGGQPATVTVTPEGTVHVSGATSAVQDAAGALAKVLQRNLTPEHWSQAFQETSPVEEAAVQATTPHSPTWWIPMCALATLVVLLDLGERRFRRTTGS